MKQRTSFRLSNEAMSLLDALAQANGISKTSVLEMAIRETAKKQGIHAHPRLQAESEQKPTSRD
jgi:predicted transcriptional regulator